MPRARPAAPPAVTSAPVADAVTTAAAVYAAEPRVFEFAGERFTVGPVSVYQLGRLFPLLNRAASELVAAQQQGTVYLPLCGLAPADDLAGLLAVILSTPQRPVDRAWVEAHLSAEDAQAVLEAFAAANPELGPKLQRMQRLFL